MSTATPDSESLDGSLGASDPNLSALEQIFNDKGFANGPIRDLEPPSSLPENQRTHWRLAAANRLRDDALILQRLARERSRERCYGEWSPEDGVSLCKHFAVGGCGISPCEFGEFYKGNMLECTHGLYHP